MSNIIIYGMRGSGKTTIGKLLAKKLNKNFIDLDLFIKEKISEEISTFIEKNGWENFRYLEHESLKEVFENYDNYIFSLGGGTIIFERNQTEILKQNLKIIYLYSDLKDISKRIENDEKNGNKRNSLTGKTPLEELEEIYEKRKEIYEKFYDLKVENNGNLEDLILKIKEKLNIGGICVPITNFQDISSQIEIINNDKRIKYAELRIDFLNDFSSLDKIISQINKEIIITNRSHKEGGKFLGTTEENLSILSKYSDKVSYIDFELFNGKYIEKLKEKLGKTKLILSYHNFEKTPEFEELKNILNEMKKYSPNIYKIAVMPQNKEDLNIIYELTKYFKNNFSGDFIFISMGELGLETRIEIPKKGGFLSFGIIDTKSAPGQINYKELYKKINF